MKTFKFIILSLLVHFSLLNIGIASVLWGTFLWFWLGNTTSNFLIEDIMKERGWTNPSLRDFAAKQSCAGLAWYLGPISFILNFILDNNFRKYLLPDYEIEFNSPVKVKKTLQKAE